MSKYFKSIDNNEDTLDSRDIQERIEELSNIPEEERDDYESKELELLLKLKEDVGSNESWSFGIIFIRDSYFEEDSEEYAYDCGFIDRDSTISIYIDWERYAEDRKVDFSSIDFDGVEYWYEE